MNVADDVSRGISVQSLTARWQRGPAFLRLSEKERPHDGSVVNETEEMKEECRRVHMCTKTKALLVVNSFPVGGGLSELPHKCSE